MSMAGIDQPDQPDGRSFSIPLDPDRVRSLKVFVRLPAEQVADLAEGQAATFRFRAEDPAGMEADEYVATFHTPETKP
jgi:hypothetical protein